MLGDRTGSIRWEWATRAIAALVLAGLLVQPVLAQDREQRRQVEPQRLDQRFEDRTDGERQEDEPETRIERQAPQPPGAQKHVITAVTIEGSTVYPPAAFLALYEPLLAREVSEGEIAGLADAIAARYHTDGYVLARAVIGPQNLALGRLHIRVIEGFVGKVTLRFGRGSEPASAQIRRYAARLKEPRPFTRQALERFVLLIDDLPGLSARAGIRPLDEQGAHELILNLARDEREFRLAADNRGTRTVGRWIGSLDAVANNPLGQETRTALRLASVPGASHELRFVDLQAEMPVGDDGLIVGLSGSHSDIAAGAGLKAFDVDSSENRFAAQARYPLIRARETSWYLHGNLEVRNSEEYVGIDNTFDDRLRSFRLGTSFYAKDRWQGETAGNLWFSRGLDLFDASSRDSAQVSRTGGRSDYSKITAYLSRFQPVGETWSIRLAATGQYAFRNLLSAEEFRLGGAGFGRGYDSSELSGEHGLGGLAELRGKIPIDDPQFNWGHAYLFYDGGAVWSEAPDQAAIRFSLASTGFGVRLGVLGNARLELEAARPLTRHPFNEARNDWRLFLGLTLYH